mmetsp:Transcript_92077/g.232406  ORF Transcript_92077/g.232406 Transcript_92077/m.232406 type:complete len:270 (-) Transcript_92077:404-1213(-)
MAPSPWLVPPLLTPASPALPASPMRHLLPALTSQTLLPLAASVLSTLAALPTLLAPLSEILAAVLAAKATQGSRRSFSPAPPRCHGPRHPTEPMPARRQERLRRCPRRSLPTRGPPGASPEGDRATSPPAAPRSSTPTAKRGRKPRGSASSPLLRSASAAAPSAGRPPLAGCGPGPAPAVQPSTSPSPCPPPIRGWPPWLPPPRPPPRLLAQPWAALVSAKASSLPLEPLLRWLKRCLLPQLQGVPVPPLRKPCHTTRGTSARCPGAAR